MDNLEDRCASLRAEIAATETQLAGLKRDLEDAEQAASKTRAQDLDNIRVLEGEHGLKEKRKWPLLDEEYRRYGRQMIVPQLGLQGSVRPNS